MRKLAVFLFFLSIACTGFYFASGIILEQASDRAIDYITQNIKIPNLEYSRPLYRSVKLSSFNAVTWKFVSFDANMVRNEVLKTAEDISIIIGEVTISLESLSERTIILSAKRLSAVAKERGAPSATSNITGSGDRMESGDLKVEIKLQGLGMTDVIRQVRNLTEELHKFSTLGVTKIPVSFSALEMFEIQGKSCTVRFLVEQKGDEYRLVMDRDDLKKIASASPGQKPNPVEIELIAYNPIKAPMLLRIRDKASTTASLAHKQDRKIPEDAYRHTLWSYLLTKMYGEEFAKEVTDAHEASMDEEEIKKGDHLNWNISSYQDLNNNAVGRSYAKMGYPESSILERVLTDRAIIRDEEMATRYNASDYERLKPAHLIKK